MGIKTATPLDGRKEFGLMSTKILDGRKKETRAGVNKKFLAGTHLWQPCLSSRSTQLVSDVVPLARHMRRSWSNYWTEVVIGGFSRRHGLSYCCCSSFASVSAPPLPAQKKKKEKKKRKNSNKPK